MENTTNLESEIGKPVPEAKVPDSVEEKRSLAKVMLAQDQPLEAIMTSTGLSKQAIFGLKGSLIKADQKLEQASSLSTNPDSRTKAFSKPESEIQAINQGDSKSQQPLEGGQRSNESMSLTLPPSNTIPDGYVIKPSLTTSEWKELSAMDKTRLITLVADLKAANSSLQVQAVTSRNNGNANNGEAEVDRQKALLYKTIRESVELQQLQNLANMNKPSQQATASPQNDPQQVLSMVKLVFDIANGKSGGKSDDAIFDRVVSIIKLIDGAKHESQQAAASNMFSLKEEEIRQTERLESKKIDWEKEKWAKEQENNAKTVDLVKVGLETFKEPIGEIISSFGKAGVNKLRGNSGQPVNTKCPSCNEPFFADPIAQQVTCPNCKAVLAKATQPQTTEVTPSLKPSETHQEPAHNKITRDETTDEEVKQAYGQ